MLGLIGLILVIAGAGMAFVRVAPSDPARWHIDPVTAPDPGQAGVKRSIPAGEAGLTGFADAVLAEPRTTLFAGSADEGRMTFIARTPVIGFPDYITVAQAGDDLVILSRLRFGQSDMGVNAARLDRILARF